MIFGIGLIESLILLVVTLVPLAIIVNAMRKEPPSARDLALARPGLVSGVWSLYTRPYKSFGTITGRATLREFWIFTLINAVIGWALGAVDVALGLASSLAEFGPVYGVFALITFIPGVAVTVRRLHDSGRSGWWMLIAAVPLIGWLIAFYQLLLKGDTGGNLFGLDPRAPFSDSIELLGGSA